MDEQNNIAALNDSAGVLPMDNGTTVNGVHDEGENHSPLVNGGAKKGRGRPPKSPGSVKVTNGSAEPKRGRGRPSKSGESSAPAKKPVVVPAKKTEEAETNGDESKKKRGRPSKSSTPSEQNNVISKPQVQSTPVINHEEQDNVDEPAKKKRGRPSGSSPKKPVVAVSSPSNEVSSTRKRGRPSGTVGIKKTIIKPKALATTNGSARKRGRPKKSAEPTTETPVEVAPPATEPTPVEPNNVA
jgi:hypothetical protein